MHGGKRTQAEMPKDTISKWKHMTTRLPVSQRLMDVFPKNVMITRHSMCDTIITDLYILQSG